MSDRLIISLYTADNERRSHHYYYHYYYYYYYYPPLNCHLIVVEGFEYSNDPRSYVVWGLMPR